MENVEVIYVIKKIASKHVIHFYSKEHEMHIFQSKATTPGKILDLA